MAEFTYKRHTCEFINEPRHNGTMYIEYHVTAPNGEVVIAPLNPYDGAPVSLFKLWVDCGCIGWNGQDWDYEELQEIVDEETNPCLPSRED